MRAMTLATLGWAVVWSSLGLSKLGLAVPVLWIYGIAGILGLMSTSGDTAVGTDEM